MSDIWRFLNQNENNDNEFDIYSIMRSELMKEYYRKNIKLTAKAKELIIINSYTSIYKQFQKLQELYKYCINDKYKEEILNMIHLYEFFIRLISTPELIFLNRKILYILKKTKFTSNEFIRINGNHYNFWMEEYIDDDVEIFTSINEVYNHIEKESDNNAMFYVKLYDISKETIYISELEVKYIDKSFTTHRISMNIEFVPEILKETYYRYNNYTERFYIPYNNGDKLSITIPGLNKQLSGIVVKEFDGYDWYTFLENFDNEYQYYKVFLDISDTNINSGTSYSIFDFIK